jgi:threonine/homoserine/homoserine lactone efflux protein
MSVGLEILAGGIMGFVGSIPLTGPVALLVMTRGLSREYSQAKLIAAGASLAEGLLAGLVFAGLGLCYSRFPGLEHAIQWLGPAALIGIGAWFCIRGVSREQVAAETSAKQGTGYPAFLLGLGLVMGNPGMIGTWGGAVAALEGTGMLQADSSGAFGFGAGVCAGVFSWFILLLRLIKSHGDLLRTSLLNVVVKCIGLALVLVGAISFASLLGLK